MMFADTLTAGEQAKAGTIRAIGVATPQRTPVMPDVPPISDTVPGFSASSWWGIGAPHGTSADIVKALNTQINVALADATIKERFAAMGALLLGGPPDGFRKLIADETEKWGKVIKFAGISAG